MKKYIFSLIILLTFCTIVIADENRNQPRSIVGAIRWDAWHGNAGLDSNYDVFGKKKRERLTPGMAVERSLSPKHWHYRLPFYAKVISENKVEIRANSQHVMDQEIIYASNAGLDYWAFLIYHPKSPMTIGLDLYLSSTHQSKINFCIILHKIRETQKEIKRIVGYMKNPQYVKVLNGRPLIFTFQCKASKKFYKRLLKAAVASGLSRPYIVYMGHDPAEMSFDAVSSYTGKTDERYWDRLLKNKGHKVVPSVSAGWDPRPRIENPVPWEGGGPGKPVKGGPVRTPQKAASDIAARVRTALEWNTENPDAGEANAVIIYAWNEFDEGGWICPTLSEGTNRLDAISKVLKIYDKIDKQKMTSSQ